MDENLERALARERRLMRDLEYYVSLTDLLQTEVEELREVNKALRGQLSLKSLDVTYPANVA